MMDVEQNNLIQEAVAAGRGVIIGDQAGTRRAWLQNLATQYGRQVFVHSPIDPSTARFQLGVGLKQASETREVARFLLGTVLEGVAGNVSSGFWGDSASMLLGACLIRFSSVGDIYEAFQDSAVVVERLGAVQDDAFVLSTAFRADIAKDGQMARNVAALIITALAGWADIAVRNQTAVSDFGMGEIGKPGSVTVFSVPARMERVFRGYLRACLWCVQESLAERGLTESVLQVLA